MRLLRIGFAGIVACTRCVVPGAEDEDKERGTRWLLAETGFGDIRSHRAGADSGATLVFASRS